VNLRCGTLTVNLGVDSTSSTKQDEPLLRVMASVRGEMLPLSRYADSNAAAFASGVVTSKSQPTISRPLQIAETDIDPSSRRTALMIHSAISIANSSDSYSLGIESSNPI